MLRERHVRRTPQRVALADPRDTDGAFRHLPLANPLPVWVHETFQFFEADAAAIARYDSSRTPFLTMATDDINTTEDGVRRETIVAERWGVSQLTPALRDLGCVSTHEDFRARPVLDTDLRPRRSGTAGGSAIRRHASTSLDATSSARSGSNVNEHRRCGPQGLFEQLGWLHRSLVAPISPAGAHVARSNEIIR